MRAPEVTWRQFVALRAWEFFDPDLDNEGGADSITEQAESVLHRLAGAMQTFLDAPEAVDRAQ